MTGSMMTTAHGRDQETDNTAHLQEDDHPLMVKQRLVTDLKHNKINTDLNSWKDISRSPPRGPAAKVGRNGNQHDWDRTRERQYDRGYGNRPRSSPSPRRGRGSYRDRDREGYKSSSYSRSRSRSRSSHGERPRRIAAPPNKEIMMEGLATDMTEEDVRSSLPFLPQPVHHWPIQFDTCLET